jgi:hypothetical protein
MGYALGYAALVFLPVLVTRYAWPTHYLMALPAVAFAAVPRDATRGRARLMPEAGVLLFGALLFYAAHLGPLQVLGEAGCLALAAVVFLAAVGRRAFAGAAA